jgi:putative tricarboxylic transport membrane protein
VIKPRFRDLLPSRQEWREANMPTWRGTLLGFLIGIVPGAAHVISTFVSYALERRISRHPEQFGQGAVAGVAGPESANNAATSGAFVPMLALGVPGAPVAALLLAAMMIHGVTPGPLLIKNDPAIFWTFIASMYVGNVVLLILNLPLVGLFVNLLRIPYPVLYPIVLVCSILGVYAVSNSIVDVWLMIAAGALGYVLRKLSFEPAPIVLGLVLAPMLELALRQSLAMSAGSYLIFVTRPIAATLLAVAAVLILLALRPLVTRAMDWRATLPAESETR